jgi:hypothetical protein
MSSQAYNPDTNGTINEVYVAFRMRNEAHKITKIIYNILMRYNEI